MSRRPPDNTSECGSAERRSEHRRTARGAGWIEPLDAPGTQEFQLVDVSASGFRARHSYAELCAGQKVRFQHTHAAGIAVVVWNRILGGEVESGFLIVAKPV